MLTHFRVSNFRSIKQASIDLGAISVFIGGNSVGKTSILYGLLTLKNFVTNPNQSLDSLFILPSAGSPFVNLGAFQQVVFNKDEEQNIHFEIHIHDKLDEKNIEIIYSVSIGKTQSYISLNCIEPFAFSSKIEVTVPYQANKFQQCEFKLDDLLVKFQWNGLNIITNINITRDEFLVEPDKQKEIINLLTRIFQLPLEELNKVDFVPSKRGFTKIFYSTVPLQQQIINEDEIATLIAIDRELSGKITSYLEMIFPKIFQAYVMPGTATFYLQLTDRNTKLSTDLVNEGFGTNQVVTILAKTLQKNKSIITIDEPEIHLHPSIIDKLADTLVDIVKNEEKSFLMTTHSDHFIESLLRNVTESKIEPEKIKIYYLSKSKKETIVEHQEVSEKGQIKGGLKSFYETELKNLKKFFKIIEED